jgi:hypothetical protein
MLAENISTVLKLCSTVVPILSEPSSSDPILQCALGALKLSGLTTNPDALLKLADEKLHVFPFKDVEVCWRRLYTDASIAKAVLVVEKNIAVINGVRVNDEEEWLTEVVKMLDMALIMTGAPLREDMIASLFSGLESYMNSQDEEGPPKKRRKVVIQDTFPITTLRAPSVERPVQRSEMRLSQFEKHLLIQQPCVITNALASWPAFHERPWRSPKYLLSRTLNGRRLVPIELGRSYTDEGWGQKIITFKEFLDKYMLSDAPEEIAYLAQHDLFAQIPSLRNDISIPDFCYVDPPEPADAVSAKIKETFRKKLEEPLLNAWFGPAGTISPLHTDPFHNVLCQVVGKKYVRLYAPDKTEWLFPRGMEGGVDMSNTSRVPVEMVEMGDLEENPDGEFAGFADVPYVEALLEEGEMLYIPVGWWHYVRSLTPSFSVSFWWN